MGDRGSGVQAGRVGRAHGLDGSFYVTAPIPRLLGAGMSIVVAGHIVEIVRRAGTDARPIVRVSGVEDRSAAEALRGAALTVEQARAPALDEDEWWAHELEGCEVHGAQRLLGTVARLIELPSCEALEVRRPGGEEALLIPMVKDAIRVVDIAGGRIEVDEEFLGLAEPSSQQAGAGSERQHGD